jgi:hypothetical protein
MDENQIVDRVLEAMETKIEAVASEPTVPEQVPVAEPKAKRVYTHRADGEKVRVQIVGYLTVCLGPDESLSAGQLAELLGEDVLVVGYHCRALLAAGVIGATGEKRGRKYHPVRS